MLLSFSVNLGIDNGYGVFGQSVVELDSTGRVFSISTYFTANGGEEIGHIEQLPQELDYKQRFDLREAVEVFLQGVASNNA